MSFGRNVLIQLAMALDAILESQFNSANGRQFLMRMTSASVFGISLTMPRLCAIESCPVSKEKFSAFSSISAKSFQKTL